jgi:hypothetical protein
VVCACTVLPWEDFSRLPPASRVTGEVFFCRASYDPLNGAIEPVDPASADSLSSADLEKSLFRPASCVQKKIPHRAGAAAIARRAEQMEERRRMQIWNAWMVYGAYGASRGNPAHVGDKGGGSVQASESRSAAPTPPRPGSEPMTVTMAIEPSVQDVAESMAGISEQSSASVAARHRADMPGTGDLGSSRKSVIAPTLCTGGASIGDGDGDSAVGSSEGSESCRRRRIAAGPGAMMDPEAKADVVKEAAEGITKRGKSRAGFGKVLAHGDAAPTHMTRRKRSQEYAGSETADSCRSAESEPSAMKDSSLMAMNVVAAAAISTADSAWPVYKQKGGAVGNDVPPVQALTSAAVNAVVAIDLSSVDAEPEPVVEAIIKQASGALPPVLAIPCMDPTSAKSASGTVDRSGDAVVTTQPADKQIAASITPMHGCKAAGKINVPNISRKVRRGLMSPSECAPEPVIDFGEPSSPVRAPAAETERCAGRMSLMRTSNEFQEREREANCERMRRLRERLRARQSSGSDEDSAVHEEQLQGRLQRRQHAKRSDSCSSRSNADSDGPVIHGKRIKAGDCVLLWSGNGDVAKADDKHYVARVERLWEDEQGSTWLRAAW